MTKEEQNKIVKEALERNLQKNTKIPDDIGNTFRHWLYGKIKLVSDQLKQPDTTQDAEQAQNGQSPEQTQEAS